MTTINIKFDSPLFVNPDTFRKMGTGCGLSPQPQFGHGSEGPSFADFMRLVSLISRGMNGSTEAKPPDRNTMMSAMLLAAVLMSLQKEGKEEAGPFAGRGKSGSLGKSLEALAEALEDVAEQLSSRGPSTQSSHGGLPLLDLLDLLGQGRSQDDEDAGQDCMHSDPLRLLPLMLPPKDAMSDQEALSILKDHFDDIKRPDGLVGRAELEQAAEDESNPRLAAAAQHLLDNEALMDGLDTAHRDHADCHEKTDGLFSLKDLNAAMDEGNAWSTTDLSAGTAMKKLLESFSELAGQDGDDKTISKSDLRKAAGDQSDPALAKAAQFFLDNPTALRGLETAFDRFMGKDRKPDDKLSTDDLTIALASSPPSSKDESILKTMDHHSDSLFSNGPLNGRDVLRMALGGHQPDGSRTPPDLQMAMLELLQSPELRRKLDSAAKMQDHSDAGPLTDGKIGRRDLEVLLGKVSDKPPPETSTDLGANSIFGRTMIMALLSNLKATGRDDNNTLMLLLKMFQPDQAYS